MPSTEIFVNGRWYAPEEARIPADDRGFSFSEGLFDTMRVRHGRVCLGREHLGRLRASCGFLGFPFPEADLEAVALEGARRHGLSDASARMTVTSGAGGDLGGPGDRPGSLVVQIRAALGPGSGLKVHVSSHRQSATSVLYRHKTLRYLERAMAVREARAQGADEALFLNDRGELAEGTTASVFWAKGGVLFTPSLDCNILAGVTRMAAIRAARELGIEVREVRAPEAELLGADEAFLTSATRGVAPVAAVNGRRIGPGGIAARLGPAVARIEDGA